MQVAGKNEEEKYDKEIIEFGEQKIKELPQTYRGLRRRFLLGHLKYSQLRREEGKQAEGEDP